MSQSTASSERAVPAHILLLIHLSGWSLISTQKCNSSPKLSVFIDSYLNSFFQIESLLFDVDVLSVLEPFILYLEAQQSENEDHGIWSHHFMAKDGETVETLSDFILGGSKITADAD